MLPFHNEPYCNPYVCADNWNLTALSRNGRAEHIEDDTSVRLVIEDDQIKHGRS